MLSEQLNLFGEPLRSPRPPANIRITAEELDVPAAPEEPLLAAVLMPEAMETTEALPAEIVEQRAMAIEQSMPDGQPEDIDSAAPDLGQITAAERMPIDDLELVSDEEDAALPESQYLSGMAVEEDAVVGQDAEQEFEEIAETSVFEDASTELDNEADIPTHATTLDELTDLVISHQAETPEWVGTTDNTEETTIAQVEEAVTAEPVIAETVAPEVSENNDDWSHGKLNIPPDRELFQRQYYTMRETTAMMGMTHAQLRNWENDFDVLQPRKNRKGDRYFRPVDIKNLELIYHLIKEKKYTADGARAYLKQHKHALDHFALVKKLEGLKSFLFELKANL